MITSGFEGPATHHDTGRNSEGLDLPIEGPIRAEGIAQDGPRATVDDHTLYHMIVATADQRDAFKAGVRSAMARFRPFTPPPDHRHAASLLG